MHTPSVLDLNRPRDLGGILGTTFTLYGRHFLVFAAIAFGVAIPVDLLVYGVAAEQLWSDHDESPGVDAAVLEFLAPILITTPLITAGHVHAVMEIGSGRTPRAGGSLRAALSRLPSVAGATILFSIAAALGTLALILPGIYVWVRFAFSAQAVMAEDLGAREALAEAGSSSRTAGGGSSASSYW
jgi:hypothetical protein